MEKIGLELRKLEEELEELEELQEPEEEGELRPVSLNYKKYIANIFYNPENPLYFSYVILPDWGTPPEIECYADWAEPTKLT